MFDVIVGSGSGALLAILIGLENYYLDSISRLFSVICDPVFGRPIENFFLHLHEIHRGLTKANATLLRDVYSDLIDYDPTLLDMPPKTMASYRGRPHVAVTVGQGVRRGLISSFDVGRGGDDDWPVWEALAAATATPTHFAAFPRLGLPYHDGSVLEPNPAKQAYLCARKIYGEDVPILALASIGTGCRDADGTLAGLDLVDEAEKASNEMALFRKQNRDHFKSYFRLNLPVPSVNIWHCDSSELDNLRLEALQCINEEGARNTRDVLIRCLTGARVL